VTSTRIAGLKVAICSKLRRLTAMEAQALVAELQVSPASLVCYSLRRLVLGCAKPSFFDYSEQNSNARTKKPGSVKATFRGLHSPAAHPDNPSDQLTSCNQNYPL